MNNPQRSEHVVSEAVGSGLGVFDQANEQSYLLNETSALVFQHADGQTTPQQMTELLSQQFNVERNQAEQLLGLTVNELQKANLLEGDAVTTTAAPLLGRRQFVRTLAATGLALALMPMVAPVAQAKGKGRGKGRDKRDNEGCPTTTAAPTTTTPAPTTRTTTQEPTTQEPTTQEPTTQEPSTTTEEPTTQEPSSTTGADTTAAS